MGQINDIKVFTQSNEDKWLSYILDGIIRRDVNQGQLIRMFANDIADKSLNFIVIIEVLYTLEDYFKTEERKAQRYKFVLDIIAKAFPSMNEGKNMTSFGEIFHVMDVLRVSTCPTCSIRPLVKGETAVPSTATATSSCPCSAYLSVVVTISRTSRLILATLSPCVQTRMLKVPTR